MSLSEHETEQERVDARRLPPPIVGRADLFAVIGHDLRQPLSAAMMATAFAAELLDAGSCAELARSQLELARRCMRQTLHLAEDLLAMGQAGAGTLRLRLAPIDVGALLEEARAVVAMHAGAKHVALFVTAAPSLPPVVADRDRLLQVLANVCGNAVKFTPAGGRVILRAEQHDGSVEASVTDSGPGIPSHELPHVFDPYWRSETGAGGAGLGLFIARWLVEAHGGRIEARPARAGGLTIVFTIPLLRAAPASGGLPDGGLPE